jgi:Rps23 Pro-64 3,4-dihydroxylase Tpa1-like proline 4-hydroxylase
MEDRAAWDEGQDPRGSVVEDISPMKGSLVIFDSVTVPHQVEAIRKGRRIAMVGWFHEETQRFPEGLLL